MSVPFPAIAAIQRHVAERYGVRVPDLRSARRARAVVRPRHAAIYLCRELTPHSLPTIAREFGRRDHTTVIYACRRVEERMAHDPDEAAAMREIADEIVAAEADADGGAQRELALGELGRLLDRRRQLLDSLERIDLRIEALGRREWGAGDLDLPAEDPCP